LVQTDFPDHPLYRALVGHDYDRYAETLLAERQNLGLLRSRIRLAGRRSEGPHGG